MRLPSQSYRSTPLGSSANSGLDASERDLPLKGGASMASPTGPRGRIQIQVIEKDSPQPQVDVALGLEKTNPFPCSPSW